MLTFEKVPIDNERIEKATILLRSGDLSELDYLLKAHMGLAACIAGRFAKKNVDIEDEIYSAVQEILYSRLLDISKGEILKNNNLGAYLNSHISFSLRKLVDKYRLNQAREEETVESFCFSDATYNLVIDEIMGSDKFSDKEKQFIKLLIEGYSTNEIGEQLNVTRQRLSIVKRSLATKLAEFI